MNLAPIIAIALKDLRQLFRDRMALFFATAFPLIVAIFFGTMFSGGSSDSSTKAIEVLLVDEDQSPAALAFSKDLKAATELRVIQSPDMTRQAAMKSVRKGDNAAVIIIPKGFGVQRDNLFMGQTPTIELGVDPSRRAESGMLEGILTKYGFMQMQAIFADPGVAKDQLAKAREALKANPPANPLTKAALDRLYTQLDGLFNVLPPATAATSATPSDAASAPKTTSDQSDQGGFAPMQIRKVDVVDAAEPGSKPKLKVTSAFVITFAQGVIWGVMGCALGFAISMVSERSGGTMTRLLVAPLARSRILAGKGLACFIATVLVSLLVLFVGIAFFGVRPTSYPLLLLAVFSVAICFVGIMMLLAVFGKSERGGNSLGWGVMLMLSMIGGGMLPLIFMPSWMQTLSMFSPIRYAIIALEGGIWRNFTLLEMLAPCGILIAIGIAGYAVGARLLSRGEAA